MDAVETCRIETGVPGGLVNVRERPGMAGVVRFYAADGELLQTIGETGGAAEGVWRRVRTDDGRSGWVYAPLCVDER
jgi:SH3-like domain-containing protein